MPIPLNLARPVESPKDNLRDSRLNATGVAVRQCMNPVESLDINRGEDASSSIATPSPGLSRSFSTSSKSGEMPSASSCIRRQCRCTATGNLENDFPELLALDFLAS